MSDHPDWLPDVLKYSKFNGDWGKFLDEVYTIFERDFKKSRVLYMGMPLTYDSRMIDGKEAVFWHITSKNDMDTGKREPDIRRCERITWPKPIVEHSGDKNVSIWESQRKKTNSQRQTRILIWLEHLDYIVVLAVRPRVVILVTAYCTDFESHKKKLKKERDDYYKMQKPPFLAT